jgi:arylsulfatase A-like enzyme
MDGIPLQPLAADPGRERSRELLFENGVHGSTAIRTHRWVLIDHTDGRELYDLRRDPHQLRSLAGSPKPRARRVERELMRRLRELRDCRGPAEC